MKVLMLGWEFSPVMAGGLGVACRGLTEGLTQAGIDVLFLLPRATGDLPHDKVRVVGPQQAVSLDRVQELARQSTAPAKVRIVPIPASLHPYGRPPPAGGCSITAEGQTQCHSATLPPELQALVDRIRGSDVEQLYGCDLFSQVQRFALLTCRTGLTESFDVIHAHDWMTFQAGTWLAALTGKPLVLHVHSTEFDRSGSHADPRIVDIERQALHRAQAVVTVSHFTRHQVLRRYGVPGDRVHVVYNACQLGAAVSALKPAIESHGEKMVLFLGRVTGQKGPEFFLAAAEQVLAETQSVRFIVGGAGEGIESAVALAARKGIAHRVLFTGFLRSGDIERVFRLADLFVMPSQSEPFGLAALEAAGSGVPVILTRQSGAAEVLTHALKVDYGDVDGLKAAILRVLHDSALAQRLREGAWSDVARLTWEASAGQCLDIYHGLCGHLVTGQR